MSQHVELLIIGAGPAGMAAALAAAPSGVSIIVLDDNPLPGGQIWRVGPHAQLPAKALHMRQALADTRNIKVLSGTRVVALTGHQCLLLEDADRGWQLTYERLILCTGARELLLPFPGWTLPGVTGAGGLQALIKGGMPVAAESVVIAGTGPLLLASAATAKAAGARRVQIAEQASLNKVMGFAAQLPKWPGKALQALSLMSPHYRCASHVVEALGDKHLEAVRLRQNGKIIEIACTRLACGFGLIPNIQLAQALGCPIDEHAIAVDEWQTTPLVNHYAAGECTGVGGSELALIEGAIAGYAAVGDSTKARVLWPQRQRWQRFADLLNTTFALDPALKSLPAPDTLVCRCEDVPYAALQARNSWTDAKLHTRCGMGACQGRVCGAATQVLFGWSPPVPRPPFSPARIATLACVVDEPAP